MTTRKYTSRSQQTTLTGSVTSGATVIPVVAATTLLSGVTVSAGQTFTVVIDPDTALEEVVDVTSVSANNLTVTRGIDGSTPQDHSAGAVIRHMIIGRDLRESNLHIEASASYNDGSGSHTLHGLGSSDGSVVGTTATQTLTNKTLIAPILTATTENDAGISFQGATVDSYTTTLSVVDPTANRTITLPNTSGNVVVDTATQTLTNKTITTGALGSNLDAGGYKITNLATPTLASDAVRKDFADAQVAAAATSATSAAASATAAATSAASAATSATSAAASASASATSAASALTSANSAATSASTMAASVSAAATSATSAAASATAAATSATSAAASATAAATSATSAAASATAAATSATSAAASATTAAASVATIASYATTASNSAAAAATSATSAAASATAAATSATSAATSATSAATTYTAYDQRYLGSKSSAPTVDNQGGTLIVGATYWNTTTTTMYVWTGSTWNAISSASAVTSVSGTAGRITSSGGTAPTIDLATTAVTPGTYKAGDFTVDAYGRITSAATGTAASTTVSGIVQLTDSTGSTSITTAATPNSVKSAYDLAGTKVASVTTGNAANIVVGGTATAPTVNLATTAVTSGSYTAATITVDAYGRITAASSTTPYAAPTLGSTSIGSGATVTTVTGLTLSNATLSGTLTAAASAGVAGQVLQSTGTGVQWATPSSGVTNWTNRKGASTGASALQTITYNGSNLYVAAGVAGTLFTSSDGLSWTARTSGFGSNLIRGVAYGNGIFVAVGNNGTITTSTDGITWTARTSGLGTGTIYDVKYLNSLFIAVGSNSVGATYGITTSSDGITWTSRTITGTFGTVAYNVAYGNGYYVLTGVLSTNNAAYSTNGTTWTAFAAGSATLTWCSYTNGYWVLGGYAAVSSYYQASVPTSTWTLINQSAFNISNAQSISSYNNKIYYLSQGATGGATVAGYVAQGFISTLTPSFTTAGYYDALGAPTWLPIDAGITNSGERSQMNCLYVNSSNGQMIIGDPEGRIYTSF